MDELNTSTELSNGEEEENSETKVLTNGKPNDVAVRSGSNAAQLQKKLERRIEKAWSSNKLIDQQPKKSFMIPIGRLPVPNKATSTLVTWDSDSETEFECSPISNENHEINQQLLANHKDDLSLEFDDLDLIPPKPLSQRCICCQASQLCSIQ
uniref:Uncharacterized protein n=1 Tax=Strigamia maritima TaxID=126957 RepID=T1JET9_STRMM